MDNLLPSKSLTNHDIGPQVKRQSTCRKYEYATQTKKKYHDDFKLLYKEKQIADRATRRINQNLMLFVDKAQSTDKSGNDDSEEYSNESISSACASELDFLFNYDMPNLFIAGIEQKKVKLIK